MRPGLSVVFRTTTFRLALAQAGVFTLFAAALLSYVYFTTAVQLTREAEQAASEEFAALELIYHQGGIKRLNQEVIERAAASGQLLYLLAAESGAVISGDFSALPQSPQGAGERAAFTFEAGTQDTPERRRARGRVGRLLHGPILLVARDMGEARAIVRKITQAVWTGAVLGLVLSLVSGVLASRQAVQRIQDITRTTREVMAGDLSRRAPTWVAGDEFDVLASALNAMLARLERLVLSSRNAGDSIAHDLRTPLARLRQRLEAALDGDPDSQADREALRAAARETEAVLATFNAVLRLARLQTATNWQFEAVDVSAIVEELAEFYGPVAEDQNLSLTAEVAVGLYAKGDRSLINQALANLVENALKYTPNGGRVHLRAHRRSDGTIEASVADTGPGIPLVDRERVLERFVRLEAARTTPGAGLGLSLVAAVAELHEGRFAMEDGLGGMAGPGLRAVLTLPPP